MNRIIPYPPNLRRTAARIIEPSKGASTWALGSQRCVIYMGILTKKASIRNIIIEKLDIIIILNGNERFLFIKIILISKGRDAIKV